MRCNRCPGYRENVKTAEARQRTSDGWHKYLGFRLGPEKIYCDGCQAPDKENPRRLLRGCTIRKCAIINGVETCAHCSKYPCEDVKALNHINRETTEGRLGSKIPEEDYLTFLEPYENVRHLNEIHSSLGPKDILEAKVSSTKPRVEDFPGTLRLSMEEISAFRALHQLLSNLASITGDTYARQVALEKTRQYLLRLLWVFGTYGVLKKEDDLNLVVDSETYSAQMRQAPAFSSYPRMLSRIKLLQEHGVLCKHVPLAKEKCGKDGWLTPTGALRKKGWLLKTSFENKVGGAPALRALKIYVQKLDNDYGKRAFSYFSKVDMHILSNERHQISQVSHGIGASK
jgi:hypothetical protein